MMTATRFYLPTSERIIILHLEHTEEVHQRNQHCCYLRKFTKFLAFAMPVAVAVAVKNTYSGMNFMAQTMP